MENNSNTLSKKILIFSFEYLPHHVGGAEIAVQEITNRISKSDITFHMITRDVAGEKEQLVGNVLVHSIRTRSKYLFIFRAFLKAIQLHKKYSYDGIWSIMANYAGFAALFFKLRFPRVHFLLTLQEGDPIAHILHRVRFVRPLFNLIFRKADSVQVISHYLADFGKQMGFKGEPVVIPNGVDIEHFSKQTDKKVIEKKEGDIVLITASRLVKKNAVGDIISTLVLLPENYKLLIAGTGELESFYKLKTKSYKLENRVTFLGHISHDDLPSYLQAADIFIRPSLSEGLGNAFLEAMTAGIPVIATPVGGIPDFLKDGETGIFCEPNNPESIARAVERFKDSVFREKVVTNAKKMVEETYNWVKIAKSMELLFLAKNDRV